MFITERTPLHVAEVKIVEPSETIKYGQKQAKDSQDEFLRTVGTWPTDHKALLVMFEL